MSNVKRKGRLTPPGARICPPPIDVRKALASFADATMMADEFSEVVDRRGNLQDELIAAAEQIRPTLPKRIDGATLIGISTADTSLTYQDKLDIKNSQLPANAVDALNKAAVQQACKSTQMVELMSMGATYINSYVDADSRWVAQFTVRNRDCET